MSDIFGHRIPSSRVGETLTILAVVSIPLAAVVGIGLGARAVYRRYRLRHETPEEQCARMERILHLQGQRADEL